MAARLEQLKPGAAWSKDEARKKVFDLMRDAAENTMHWIMSKKDAAGAKRAQARAEDNERPPPQNPLRRENARKRMLAEETAASAAAASNRPMPTPEPAPAPNVPARPLKFPNTQEEARKQYLAEDAQKTRQERGDKARQEMAVKAKLKASGYEPNEIHPNITGRMAAGRPGVASRENTRKRVFAEEAEQTRRKTQKEEQEKAETRQRAQEAEELSRKAEESAKRRRSGPANATPRRPRPPPRRPVAPRHEMHLADWYFTRAHHRRPTHPMPVNVAAGSAYLMPHPAWHFSSEQERYAQTVGRGRQ
jgi:hypothetical protein